MAARQGNEGTLSRGQSAIEVMGVLVVLVTVFWGLSGRDEGALAVLWQAWQARWQRFAATLALPL
ncbi:MAG: hypothetical protein AB7E55_14500 [Pigmentiphaga sp.]